jgi:hypothetical protein
LLDQDAAEPGEGQSTWPYGLEGIAWSYQCQIKLMLGTQALTQIRALGPFSESSSDDKEESLTNFDENRISTAYPGFDSPEDLRRFLNNDNLLGGPTSTLTTTLTHLESASCAMETLTLGILRRHPVSTLPSTLWVLSWCQMGPFWLRSCGSPTSNWSNSRSSKGRSRKTVFS